MLWLGLGLIGAWALNSAWRTAQLAEFRRSVDALALLTPQRDWSEPWESDPEWIRLESQLKADLVPLTANPDTESHPSTDAVVWVLSPKGQWQATVTVPVAASRFKVRALRATRIFDDHPLELVWWLAWSAFNCSFAAVALLRRRLEPAAIKLDCAGMEPWLALAGSIGDVDSTFARLPTLPVDASVLARRLNSLGDRVNARLERLEVKAEQLEQIFAQLNEGMLAVDDLGRVIKINRSLRSQLMLGADEFLMRPLVEVVRLPRVVELLEQVLRTGQSSEQMVEVGSGGRFLNLLASPLPLGAERWGVLLTAIDVSSSQRSELARREFITGASHELKTPLAAIRAYTETLQAIGQDDPAATERFLNNILGQTDRMDRLVNGMLQLARAESGNLTLKLQRIDAVATIQPCLVAAIGMAQTKGISVQSHVPASQLFLLADRDAFQTIASNLLSNAIRYTPAGGRVDVELSDEGEQVLLSVTDTGVGIAEVDQQRVFERFYRVQKDRAAHTGGTGLGLAIVKQLTLALGGSISLASRKGEGTRFEIRLPAVGFTQSSSKVSG